MCPPHMCPTHVSKYVYDKMGVQRLKLKAILEKKTNTKIYKIWSKYIFYSKSFSTLYKVPLKC